MCYHANIINATCTVVLYITCTVAVGRVEWQYAKCYILNTNIQ